MRDLKPKSIEKLEAELDELRHQLFEANETIEAIRTGQVDALVVEGHDGHKLYTLKTADQAYRVFIEKMNEGALTLNKEGIILYCNSQFATMVGDHISNVIGVRFESFLATPDKERYKTIFNDAWAHDRKMEVALATGARHVPVQLSLALLTLDDRPALSVILTDLSMQKLAQQQLKDTNEQLASINHALELSNHDLQQFASVASHDLQEPLRKIQIFANMLLGRHDNSLNPETKRYVEKIIDSSTRMKILITDVLNYSKLSRNNNIFELINLTELVNELVEDFELIIHEKKANISVNELGEIFGNKGQVRQVFQNIISNSLKFSKLQQSPNIEIRSTRHLDKSFDSPIHDNGPYCIVSIKDNGIGFDEKYLAQIFDIFERLHTRDIYEGTGIGLAITKKIMDKHNGLVTAKSNSGHGAEFLLLFPVNQPSSLQLSENP